MDASRHRASFVALFCVAVTGCSSVTSSSHGSGTDEFLRRADVAYSLPRTVFNVTANKGTLTVTKGAEPDPGARFSLQHRPNAFFDDDIVAEVDDNSLLKSVTSTAKDRTGDIAVNLAEIVFTLGTNGAALPAGRVLPSGAVGPDAFVASYDPLDPGDVSRTRSELANAGFCILVGDEAHEGSSACERQTIRKGYVLGNRAEKLGRRSGVFYRQSTSVPVQIYRRERNGWGALFVGNETLFDKGGIYEVEMTRSLFVEKKVELTFQNGALAKVHINKPSELYGLSQAGLKIVKTVVAIPFEALDRNTALKNAQAANIEAKTNLLKRQDELLKLQVEQQGSTQQALVRSNVDFIEAGGRAIGAVSGTSSALEVCQTNLAASVADCRAFVERGLGGF